MIRFLCCVKSVEVTCGGDFCGFLNVQNGCLFLAVFEINGVLCFGRIYVVGYFCFYFRELALRRAGFKEQVFQDRVSFKTRGLGKWSGACFVVLHV